MLSRSGPAYGQVLPERLYGGISDINAAVFLALAIPDAEITPIQVQIFQAQFLHFAGAQPALPEQIEHGAFPGGPGTPLEYFLTDQLGSVMAITDSMGIR